MLANQSEISINLMRVRECIMRGGALPDKLDF